MKLVRFGSKGQEQAGLIDAQGQIRDVSAVIPDWNGQTLSEQSLAELAKHDLENLPLVDAATRLGAPVGNIGKIVGVALTYGKHAAEAGLNAPNEPMFMIISRTAVNGPYDDVMFPRGGTELDWEVELGVVIGKGGSYISMETAHEHIAGYCVANDVSERQFQLERGSQWTKGKSADTLKPLGPWLVTKDEVGNANALDISMTVSGVTRQNSNTSDMMYTTAELVSRISEYLSWEAGDVMITGTPEGVGYGMRPQLYLKPGDVLEAKIEGLGAQRNLVVPFQQDS